MEDLTEFQIGDCGLRNQWGIGELKDCGIPKFEILLKFVEGRFSPSLSFREPSRWPLFL